MSLAANRYELPIPGIPPVFGLFGYDDEKDCDQALDDTLSSDGVTNRLQNKEQFAR
jgi:hypothetical protein